MPFGYNVVFFSVKMHALLNKCLEYAVFFLNNINRYLFVKCSLIIFQKPNCGGAFCIVDTSKMKVLHYVLMGKISSRHKAPPHLPPPKKVAIMKTVFYPSNGYLFYSLKILRLNPVSKCRIPYPCVVALPVAERFCAQNW